MAVYGYARVSTTDQNIESQLKALKEAGASRIFEDKATGKDIEREGLQALLTTLKEGDTLVVTKLDRLARNLKDGIELMDELNTKGIKFHVINMGLFDGSTTSKMIRNILLSVAEWEREMIKERQMEGIAIAKANGLYKGRPPKYTERNPKLKQALEWYRDRANNGKSVKEICEITGIGKATLYRKINQYEIE